MSRHMLTGGNNTLNSEQIRAEIHRFESVHPCIYQIYDLINLLPPEAEDITMQLRDQIVAIEDSFVNSHEWTLSRSISEMRLGIVGTTQSGKTALVHRYLTSSYTSEESPEGGRFKKEVVIEGQSHLLLIRDEGQQHLDVQFCQWVDAVVFVFSVFSEQSFDSIQELAHQMSKYRNISDLPLILVGTKDNLSEKRARVISEDEGRQLAAQMKRCSYYETNSSVGTNVERVFKDACCKIIQLRFRNQLGSAVAAGSSTQLANARTPTPTHQERKDYQNFQDPRYMTSTVFAAPLSTNRQQVGYSTTIAPSSSRRAPTVQHRDYNHQIGARSGSERSMSAVLNTQNYNNYRMNGAGLSPSNSQKSVHSIINGSGGAGGYSRSSAALLDGEPANMMVYNSYSIDSMSSSGTPLAYHHHHQQQQQATTSSQVSASTSHLPTPSSTPNTQRKNRRISNIFQRPKDHLDEKTKAIEALNLGVGRAIPVKQGSLYKKSTKSALNREWKKKYVCLYSDGRLTYHQNLKDYMDKSAHGKEVFLGLATVKVSGRQRPRNTQRASCIVNAAVPSTSEAGTPTLKSYEPRRSDVGTMNSGDATSGGGSDDAIKENKRNTIATFTPPIQPQTVAGNGKKKRDSHRRIGSSGKNNDEDDECFEVVSHNQIRWEFCAASQEERDEWVTAIEEQIEIALTAQTSQPTSRAIANKHQVQALRQIAGNERCADCDASNPDWASLNLGTLICIECSGIHRNLGTHVSKVRSLELDGWPLEYMAVMQSIGNEAANAIWEYNVMNERKPGSESERDEKERWIDRKYRQKCFLKPIAKSEMTTQLINAVLERNVAMANLLFCNGMPTEEINAFISNKDKRTVLHLACSIGSVELVQLLLWNNADLRALDENGRSVLWYAQTNGFTDLFDILITAGLPSDYGLPKMSNGYESSTSTNTKNSNNLNSSQLPEGSIMGSTSSRDYSCLGDDIYARRISQHVPPPQVPTRRNMMMGQQSQSELDIMPASII